MPDSPERAAEPPAESAAAPRPLVEGEDFYREGPCVVFTEAYHRRRGYCCGSGCRHCPWNHEAVPKRD
ncbi:MAG TPA: DUF5522 domain-containing protein [Acidobacteriaceae bacterium]|nr:DUF5522 domain-containing protein [Acidobacteriaceae bacterium]